MKTGIQWRESVVQHGNLKSYVKESCFTELYKILEPSPIYVYNL